MGDRKVALAELIEKVEAGSCSLRLLAAAGFGKDNVSKAIVIRQAFNGSLDAALALHEAVLPGWCVSDLSQNGMRAGNPWGCVLEDWDLAAVEHREKRRASSHYDHATPARAFLLAILKALHAQETP